MNSLTPDGNPVTCGGTENLRYNGDDAEKYEHYERGCYKYEARNNKWTRIGQMRYPR